MTKEVQLRRGTTAQVFAFTGQVGELTPDTGLKRLVLHDGVTAGGKAIDAARGWIDGLGLANNATAPTTDIDIGRGQARDSTNATIMELTAKLTKMANVAWAAGNNNGGLFNTGFIGVAARYHVFLIEKDSDGSIDVGFDTSQLAPNRPAGYTRYRRIGSIQTDGSGVVMGFVQHGDLFLWTSVPALDVNDAALGTTRKTYSLAHVPAGVEAVALLNVYTAGALVFVSHVEAADQSPSITAAPLLTAGNVAGVSRATMAAHFMVKTNTSGQITARADASPSTLRVAVVGWIDQRGRNA